MPGRMGNCQTAEAAAVVIQHPPGGGRVERAHGALSAAAVMAANPGHYVAAVTVPGDDGSAAAASRARKRRLKLLRPDDTLALGGVYRLVSFEGKVRISCPCCRFTRHRQLSHSRTSSCIFVNSLCSMFMGARRPTIRRGVEGVRVQTARHAEPQHGRRRR